MQPTINTISSDIEAVSISLGTLAGRVPEDVWAYLRIVRNQLAACTEQVAQMERNLTMPAPCEPCAAGE